MRRLIFRLKALWKDERGVGNLPPLFFFLLLACILLYMGVDLYGYTSQKQKLMIAANEILEVVKAENGFDANNRQQFHDLVRELGIDPAKVTVYGTPKLLQRGSPIEIVARMDYTSVGLQPFGQTVRFPIEVKVNGLAHTYIR